ncbi:MAG: riboflavin biosynthesis protein RibD [Bacteroidetes bacterium]|nr:MAG: riboflavin biosynthesis protein RibD [Bacteroidota bacterium]
MQDRDYIKRCLELAKLGEFSTAPNPMVGCAIVYNGTIVAEGYHQEYGGPHAEVNAFSNLPTTIDPTKCEVYVNLEPCSHFGKTPPCADLIVAKKPKRVVIGMLDPHEKVAGKGVKKLLESSIDVKVGVLEEECSELNKKFIKAHTQNKPYVTLKWAETENSIMARGLNDSQSAKISDSRNNAFVHQLRANHQAILVGAGTANRDNPTLDVREWSGNNPIKVILSPNLSLDMDSKLLLTGKTLIYNTLKNENTDNYELVQLSKFTMDTVLHDLYKRNIHSVLVEGGPTVLQLFIDEANWDEAIILKSKTTWSDGVKAPWLGIPSYKDQNSFNDTIKYFKPA